MDHLKLFSLATANRILPLVRVVGTEVTERFYRLKHLEFSLGKLNRDREVDDWPARRLGYELEGQIEQERRALHDASVELQSLGALVSDPIHGYLHFATVVDGRPTALCWHPDEPLVQHWHYDHEGCTQRRFVPRRWLEESGEFLASPLKK